MKTVWALTVSFKKDKFFLSSNGWFCKDIQYFPTATMALKTFKKTSKHYFDYKYWPKGSVHSPKLIRYDYTEEFTDLPVPNG